ncbi:MAG: hypothetical protein WCT40_01235 [Candidatus Magasanikbacteria bacterium]|jgi:hypothetical protein
MNIKKFLGAIAVIFLVAAVVIGGLGYYSLNKDYKGLQAYANSQRTQIQTVEFLKLFVKRVLKAQGEVDFETRLKLENAVRDLGDANVLAKWQAFVNSANEVDAQKNVKDLLEVLVDKIK